MYLIDRKLLYENQELDVDCSLETNNYYVRVGFVVVLSMYALLFNVLYGMCGILIDSISLYSGAKNVCTKQATRRYLD